MPKIQTWILKDPKKDFLVFYLPGLIAIAISKLMLDLKDHWIYFFFVWLALGILDGGHVYSTLWRTYFSKNELQRRPLYYKLTPIILFILFSLWIYTGGLYLVPFVVYFTIYHNIRQLYGINKWYQKINHSFDKKSDWFLYAFCIFPVIAFHFRGDINLPIYYNVVDMIYPNLFFYNLSLLLFSLVILTFTLKEIHTYFKTKKIETTRILATVFPGVIYSFALLFSNSVMEVLFPLVVSHGLTYLILIDYSLEKTRSNYTKKIFILIIGATLLLGTTEFFAEDLFYDVTDPAKAITTSFFLTPLFCHYLFDAFLWRKDHPESKLIMS